MKVLAVGLAVLASTALTVSKAQADTAQGVVTQTITGTIDQANVILDSITNVGEKVWNLVSKGKAVVNERSHIATALPQGARNWSELQGWKVAYLKTGIQIHQPIGGTVINYDYRLVFTYNGSVDGVGKYIGYATIERVDLMSRWLAPEMDVWVEVPTIFNMGTRANPIAAMKIDIHIRTKRLQQSETVDSYVITGNGQVRRL